MRPLSYPIVIVCGPDQLTGYRILSESQLRLLAREKTTLSAGFCQSEDPKVILQVLVNQLDGVVDPS